MSSSAWIVFGGSSFAAATSPGFSRSAGRQAMGFSLPTSVLRSFGSIGAGVAP